MSWLAEKLLPGDAGKALQKLQQLRSAPPKPHTEMSELQIQLWFLTREMLSELEVEEPLRSFILRGLESFTDEELRDYARGLVTTAQRVQGVLNECGAYDQ